MLNESKNNTMEVLKINEIEKHCPQSEISDVSFDAKVKIDGKEYTIVLDGESIITGLNYDAGDYWTPPSCEEVQRYILKESHVFDKEGNEVPLFNLPINEEDLTKLLAIHC